MDNQILTKYSERPDNAPDNLSVPMSATSALLAARTITAERSKSFAAIEMEEEDGTQQSMGWSHRYKRAYWGTLLSIIEQPRFESRCLQVRGMDRLCAGVSAASSYIAHAPWRTRACPVCLFSVEYVCYITIYRGVSHASIRVYAAMSRGRPTMCGRSSRC